MAAGQSASSEAQRQLALAAAHEEAARKARATAGNYEIASVTEKSTARTLAPLSAAGYHMLADRRWPGSRSAQVDMIVVGPSGVFIIDTKAWAEVAVAGDRIYRGQEDVTDDILAFADMAYNAEGDLAEVGLAPGEVHPVVILAGRSGISHTIGPVEIIGERDAVRHIAKPGRRLTPSNVDTVLARTLEYFPQVGAPAPVAAVVSEPVLDIKETIEPEQLISDEDVQDALLESLMAAPVEEWMTFLHPTQAKVVRRNFNGPARIRGAAGTGKTVIGLHRAAYLARIHSSKVLVTTYVRTLPAVLGELLKRLAPDVSNQVEFFGVHSFARRILDERGITINIAPIKADACWERAWYSAGKNTALDTGKTGERYWKSEVLDVIKSRGITDFDTYADLERTGRKYRLTVDQRKMVWHLYQTYAQGLIDSGIHDFHDLILLAAAEMEREPFTQYRSVVIDEAQDLSAAAIRMLHALVGNEPDGLTLIGDGQQSIYPGGYTLAEVGISVAGRGIVMDTNYRNTKEVVEFAQRMVHGDEVSDIEGSIARNILTADDVAKNVSRTGPAPVIEKFTRNQDRLNAIVRRVRAVTANIETGLGDVAVLCVGNWGVKRVRDALARAGIPTIDLLDYDGTVADKVKVGTIKRSKGLEFKHVLLTDIKSEWLSDSKKFTDENLDDISREQRTLLRRELYVAMTRCRDGLWLGVI